MILSPRGCVPLRAALNLEGAADAGRLRRRAPPAGYGGLLLSPARCLIVRPYADSSELSYSCIDHYLHPSRVEYSSIELHQPGQFCTFSEGGPPPPSSEMCKKPYQILHNLLHISEDGGGGAWGLK